ncbi:MAG: 50S ribosomal protein L25 [Bdellovibrio sp.]|nr:MAG: 50S ribosomal protein L25 [Bdellovibrio sp.]
MTKSENIELTAEPRKTGRHHSRALRRQMKIPAILYGPKVENTPLTLLEKEAVKYSHHQYENTIFVIKSSDPKLNGLKVLKKSIETHPLTHRPLHMDLYAIDVKQTVRVHVEIKYVGKSAGEREGGVFNALRRDVEIECLPTEIPDSFEISIENLALNQTLHVSDLKIPENIKLITSPEEALCTVAEVQEEAPTETAEGATPTAEGSPAESSGSDQDKK